MMEKVTDKAKIVTDEQVLNSLVAQGIDKDYVEFWHSYAPRSRGKEYSPYAKFYRDLKSGKRIMAVSGLPKVTNAGFFIAPQFRQVGGKFVSEENCFHTEVDNRTAKVVCVNDQPNGRKEGDWAEWHPQVFLDGVEQQCGNPVWLETDHMNPNYHFNVLEYDYGFCKRRMRIIEGRFRDRITLLADPHYEVRVANNVTGDMKLRFGSSDADGLPIGRVVGDVEIISKEELAHAVYPITIGASPETFYPDAGVASVDGRAFYVSTPGVAWATLRNYAIGTGASDADQTIEWCYILAHETSLWRAITRGIFLFDTAGLPDTCIVSEATLSVYGSSKSDGLSITPDANIYASNPTTDTALVVADYSRVSDTPFSSAITYNAFNTAGYNNFALNADGLAAVNRTGISKFSLRNANYDVANQPPAWTSEQISQIACHFTEKGTGFKPKLVVTYYYLPGVVAII